MTQETERKLNRIKATEWREKNREWYREYHRRWQTQKREKEAKAMTGAQFEKRFVEILGENGWWAHFLSPDKTGAQPFDVIALRDDDVMAIDCKTCVDKRFQLSRIESNQFMAFQALMWKTTKVFCGFAIYHEEEIYLIPFADVLDTLKQGKGSIELKEEYKENASIRIKRNQN